MQIIYIHGFNSSAQSFKAQLLNAYLQGSQHELFLPDLPPYPHQAMAILDAQAQRCDSRQLGFIGSSLGGYYATWLAERYQAPAVLVNPAVRPYQLLSQGLGEQRNFHTGETYQLTQEHLDQLQDYELDKIAHPERLLLLTQTGDEVLDYRRGVERYRGARQVVIEGGDHGFSDFGDDLDQCLSFLQQETYP